MSAQHMARAPKRRRGRRVQKKIDRRGGFMHHPKNLNQACDQCGPLLSAVTAAAMAAMKSSGVLACFLGNMWGIAEAGR